jgi:hypothetical protein
VHQKSDAARSFLPGARGEFAETHQRLDEVITKQILFSWLREHSIMAGDGRPQGFRDRLIQGARIPHWVEARLYQRRGQPVAELADVDAGATDSAEASAEALTAPRQRPAHVLPSSPRRR